jgi:hypothetical protein
MDMVTVPASESVVLLLVLCTRTRTFHNGIAPCIVLPTVHVSSVLGIVCQVLGIGCIRSVREALDSTMNEALLGNARLLLVLLL